MTTQASNQIAETPVEQLMKVHLAWHRLCWQLPMAFCGAGWLTASVGHPVHAAEPLVEHDQLPVPPEIEGDHALFA